MKSLKISVVMPVYKTEEFIEKSILSVVNQTYTNWELICVNDATPDNAVQICEKFVANYSDKIKIIDSSPDGQEATRNRGQEATRNRGLEATTGDYVIFLDSDDTLAIDALSELNAVAERDESDIVIYSYSKIIDGEDRPVAFPENINGVYTQSELVRLLLKDITLGVLCCVGAKMYSMDFIRSNSLWFDKKYRFNEDAGFILNSLGKAERITLYNRPFYKYLIRKSNSIMSSYKPNMFSTTVKARELIKELYIDNNIWKNQEYYLRYYHELLGLINGCLLNEMDYGSKESFIKEFNTIYVYEDFNAMIDCLLGSSGKFSKQHIYVWALRKKNYALVKFLLGASRWGR